MAAGIELFPKAQIVGIFRGFREGGLEFHADLVLPYRTDFQTMPMHGQFLLVQLENPEEAVLGRITSLAADGKLTGGSGEEFSIRALREDRPIPEQLREDYLKYRVAIRVLGVLRCGAARRLTFVASHRRLPHVGSPVAFLSDELLQQVAGAAEEGADIGFFALGEFIYGHGDARLQLEPWMRVCRPSTVVKFPVANLVARRTFVFARAGFGKSNLNKLLFSKLYAQTPTIRKRGDRQVPVGTIIFDPDGEYFWPDDRGRPGLCDVLELVNQLVVFTSREGPSAYYGSFVAGGVKLDIRRLRPADVISIALSPEKQDQQNVRKLRAMNAGDWGALVDLIHQYGNQADLDRVIKLLHLEAGQEVEALAARANMTTVVKMLHDPTSQLMDMLLYALGDGKLCVVDVSQLRGEAALVLSGLILRRIFDRNQDEFTRAVPQTIPVIAVIEEAQTVLREGTSATAPYIEWVKEGRKYDLGAVMITQQPGSIGKEILSQGDNWFIFHLLSAADLHSVRQANAHFSDDLLSGLLNEPIPGQGVFWSSGAGKPFPVPIRVLSFEHEHRVQDPDYGRSSIDSYAARLRSQFLREVQGLLSEMVHTVPAEDTPAVAFAPASATAAGAEPPVDSRGVDVFALHKQKAFETLRGSTEFEQSMNHRGIPWGVVVGILRGALPESMEDRDNVAYSLVREAVSRALAGEQGTAWDTEKRATKDGRMVTFIFKKPAP